jgi:hypothetical protein
MRRNLLLVALAAIALGGAACSGCTQLGQATDVVNAPANTVVDEKAVLAAELAYGAALDTITQAARDGRLTGEQAAQVAAVIRRAMPIRQALHLALTAGNETNLLAKFNDLKQLTAELVAIGAI